MTRTSTITAFFFAAMTGAGVAGCGATPENPIEPVSGGSFKAQGLGLMCGRINPGHALAPNQSAQSCDGRLTLIHQTDGNVVAYDAEGALWSTRTAGRRTRSLVMQEDGNLVLYDIDGRPLWDSGTWRHPGAYLALQNDCNLVIYSQEGAVRWKTRTFCRPPSDLLPYFKNTRSKTLLGPDGSIVGYSETGDGNTWYYRKWQGAGNRFEKYTADDDKVYLVRDTSWNWRGYNSYDPIEKSFPLAKRRSWSEGERLSFNSTVRPFDVDSCSYGSERPQHGWTRWIRYYPNYCWGDGQNGNIGCVDSIAINSAYHSTPNQPAEVHWYAKNYGWVRYEEYNDAGRRVGDISWTTTSNDFYPVDDRCTPPER